MPHDMTVLLISAGHCLLCIGPQDRLCLH